MKNEFFTQKFVLATQFSDNGKHDSQSIFGKCDIKYKYVGEKVRTEE